MHNLTNDGTEVWFLKNIQTEIAHMILLSLYLQVFVIILIIWKKLFLQDDFLI